MASDGPVLVSAMFCSIHQSRLSGAADACVAFQTLLIALPLGHQSIIGCRPCLLKAICAYGLQSSAPIRQGMRVFCCCGPRLTLLVYHPPTANRKSYTAPHPL